MAKLTPEQRDDRLRFDYRVVNEMRSPIMSVAAYRSVNDLTARRDPIVSEAEGHLAQHYLIDFNVRTLVGEDRYSLSTSVHFDLLANGNYPLKVPVCWVISNEIPWTPHFKKGLPICIGEIWEESNGKMLLGQLLIHVAKLLNFEEVPRSENYGGYNPEAVRYWRTKLNMHPITPNLIYPVLPDFVTTKVDRTEDFFKPAGREQCTLPEFRSKRTDQSPHTEFRPKQSPALFAPSSRNKA